MIPSNIHDSDFSEILGPATPALPVTTSPATFPKAERPRGGPRLLTSGDLATFWGCTTRQVQNLASDGVIEPDAATGLFDASECTQRYILRLRNSAKLRNAGDAELKAEKLRVTREQADKLALTNAEKRGEMVPAVAVKAAWSETLRDVRAAMLAVPSRILQRLPHLTPQDLDQIDREIRNALSEAANDERP